MKRMHAWLVAGLLVAPASAAPALEVPPVRTLQQMIAGPAEAVTVLEPHLFGGSGDARVGYVGYPAVDVIAELLGEDWQQAGEAVEFRALDGYVSRIGIDRFGAHAAYLVFARADGSPFAVDNLGQNETGVPLGPYYLVWDNIASPELVPEGARHWPYQIAEIALVARTGEAVLTAGLDARFEAGASLTREHCLTCHQVNGFGGAKFEGNLAEIVKAYDEADFMHLVLTPAAEREGSTMPALPQGYPDRERQEIAGAIYEYLQAVPVVE